ncbi:MAG: HAD-IC family P-type ATPase [Candidatus Nomurabacteria bacterium]|nr:HAD-IC family P-type ATPase [Candidatus Nomurabacteria bacterium]
MSKFEIYRRVLPSVGPIVLRNVALLVNVVIFVVVVLLFIFGNKEAAVFLGIVFFINTAIAIVQDIHARTLLEKLQMLTALRVIRINEDKTETSILAEEIKKGDLIKLKLGDQTPCEGILAYAEDLEISEALVTGESDSFSKKEGDKMIAGAIVTSGKGIMEAVGIFKDSRLSIIAGEVQKYASSPSSIQTAINMVVKYSGYALVAVLVFVVARGILLHSSKLEMVTNAGALASTIIPQGLVVVITLLFAIGAANYSRRDVLFQEINATEKLGRIKNLCIDKTGTLTDNILVVEDMFIFQGLKETDANSLIHTYVSNSGDSSQTFSAVKKYINEKKMQGGENAKIINKLPFSSWRRYGAIEIVEGNISQTILVGAPDIFLSKILNVEEKKWLYDITEKNAREGKRVLCIARANGVGFSKNLSEASLSVIAVFVFRHTLRQGIKEAIKFFQERGIKIRVISGDNPNTVRAVALSVGIKGANDVISGEQVERWSDSDFKVNAREYTVFAQILPEQKVRLVEEFKKDGFTAMVGDGVNDALAMKKADLGIAMFDGVPVTRQLADVILMTNSFSDLPGAVKLADHFIRSIEINSGVYINMSLVGLLFFVIISFFGYSYPLTPLNITFINYFTVGFSGVLISYWALRPSSEILPADNRPFLKRIMPLVFACAIVEAIGSALIFLLSPNYLKIAPSNTLVGLAFIFFGFLFLIFGLNVYCGKLSKKEKWEVALLGVFQIIMLCVVLQIPLVIRFFNITLPFPSLMATGEALLILVVFGIAQYLIVRKFFLKKKI